MHILVTRPEADAAETASRLMARGHRLSLAPMIEPEFLAPALNLEQAGALAVTSRNGVRGITLHPQRSALLRLPLFAVGPATGALARDAGFANVIEGPKGARELVLLIAQRARKVVGTIVHLAGDEPAFDLASALCRAGIPAQAEVVYRMRPASRLPADTAALFRAGAFDAVLLMSPRTAEIFVTLIKEGGLTEAALRPCYICLSPRDAEPLKALGDVRTAVAARPHFDEILALVDHLSSSSGT
ncbi:MAG: uroporphyrinogen-III synthase [Hyphomicrobium sp.]|nr:uroporphyrinogen-III synthase [Hyphomicrobium sp.]